jgi:hypothetical protein
MTRTGRNTAAGFLPDEPKVKDIFGKMGLLGNGFDGLRDTEATKHLAEAAEKPENELKRSYARFCNGTAQPQDQKAIVEDLLDQTLRRAHMPYQPDQTMEQFAAYGLMRSGQDAIVIYMLKMMQDGNELPAPKTAENKGRKKTA